MKKQKQKNHPRQTSGKKNSLKNMVSIKRDRGKSKITLEQLISLMVIELGLSIDDKNDIKEVCQKLIDLGKLDPKEIDNKKIPGSLF